MMKGNGAIVERCSVEKGVDTEGETAARDPGAETLTDARGLPEGAGEALLVAVEERGHLRVDVRTRADGQNDHRQQTLEVEQCTLCGLGDVCVGMCDSFLFVCVV